MLKPGDKIGPYELLKVLGRGAFGQVWLAERIGNIIRTKVAVKVLHNVVLDSPNVYLQEARVLSGVGVHQNIVQIIDADIFEDYFVIVSEYIPGGSLDNWMEKCGGKAPIKASLDMVSGILLGISYLHSLHIIHRDLKPSNILLLNDIPKIADFGLAKVVKDSVSTGVAGTPAFMAPEAFNGKVSKQSDIWSIGVILYRMLVGKLPFDGKEWIQLMAAIVTKDPAQLPEHIPGDLSYIVLKALSKNLVERYQTSDEMIKDIKTLLALRSSDSAFLEQNFVLTGEPEYKVSRETNVIKSTTQIDQENLLPKVPIENNLPNNSNVEDSDSNLTVYVSKKARMFPSGSIVIRKPEVFHKNNRYVFEDLIFHKDYHRLWRTFAYAEGGRHLLTGYGQFGGTSLINCAIAKAQMELSQIKKSKDCLLVFYFDLPESAKELSDITYFNLWLGEVKESADDFNRLQGSNCRNVISFIDVNISPNLMSHFFGLSMPENHFETIEEYRNTISFVKSIDRLIKQKQIDKALLRMIYYLSQISISLPKIVVIFDKIKDLEILEKLCKTKLIGNRFSKIIAVARKEDFDNWEKASDRLKRLFFSKWYIPCLWELDFSETLSKTFLDTVLQKDKSYVVFLDHLKYIGRGAFGQIINEIGNPTHIYHDFESSFIDVAELAEKSSVRHNAWLERVLQLNWSFIEGDLFKGRDQDEMLDRARVGVYYLLDWIADKGSCTFEEIIESSHNQYVTISNDIQRSKAIISNLLTVLTKNNYIVLKNNQWSVIWDSKMLPKYHKVNSLSSKQKVKKLTGLSRENTSVNGCMDILLEESISVGSTIINNINISNSMLKIKEKHMPILELLTTATVPAIIKYLFDQLGKITDRQIEQDYERARESRSNLEPYQGGIDNIDDNQLQSVKENVMTLSEILEKNGINVTSTQLFQAWIENNLSKEELGTVVKSELEMAIKNSTKLGINNKKKREMEEVANHLSLNLEHLDTASKHFRRTRSSKAKEEVEEKELLLVDSIREAKELLG